MKPGFQRETEPSRVSSNPYCMLEVGKESNMPPKSKKLHSGRLISKSGATELAASQTFCSSVMFIVVSFDGHPQQFQAAAVCMQVVGVKSAKDYTREGLRTNR